MKYTGRGKKKVYLLLIAVSVSMLFLLGCAKKSSEDPVVARINEYELTLKEFEYQLAAELEMEPDFKRTKEAKEAFLDRLVLKELGVQEAMRLKLDRKETFVRSIERYWQSTLIRDLLALKGEDINKRTFVTQEEIQARYLKMKEVDDSLAPLDEIKEHLISELKDEKNSKKLKEWIYGLPKNAKIEIDRKLLHGGS